ncbi:hypothetical protein [Vibrio phage Va2]|nr:hypothetical protein [Vibrio phage Va2]
MDINWKSILGTLAPTLATALGGPFAGAATKYLASELLGDENASEEQIASAVMNASPDVLARIKELDHGFKIRMRELDIDEKQLDIEYHKINQQDRDSARKREISTDSNANSVLAGIVVLGFFCTVAYILSGRIGAMDAGTVGLVGTIVGYVSAKADQVLGYYFGGMTKGKNTEEPSKIGSIVSKLTPKKK